MKIAITPVKTGGRAQGTGWDHLSEASCLASQVRPSLPWIHLATRLYARNRFRSALVWAFALQLCVALAGANRVAAQEQPPGAATATLEEEEEKSTAAPVLVDSRPVVYIYASVGGFSQEARAEAIEKRLMDLAKARKVPVESIQVEEHDAWSAITSAGNIIMLVTDQDAAAAGRVRQRLAQEDAELIRQAVQRYRQEHRWTNLLLGLLYTVLASAALLLVLRGVWKLREMVGAAFEKWMAKYTRSDASKMTISAASYLARLFLTVGHACFWLVVIALAQAYITAVLRFFPQTHEVSRATTSWLYSQLLSLGREAVDYLPNLVLVIVIGGVAYIFLQFSAQIFRDVERGVVKIRGFYPDWARPTANLVRILVLALAAVVMFPYLPGAKSPAFQGITIFLGVLLSLGSSSAVANAVAGTILNYTRSFQVGDMVSIGDTFGEVVEKGLIATRVRATPRTEIVTIPNGLVMGAAVRNYSAEAKAHGATLHTTVTIGYDAPWRRVHELLISAALSTSHILEQPAPFVLQTALNDFYVSYELSAYTDTPRQMPLVYSELHQNIQDKFNQGGIEINSPHYTALRDGNAVTIPAAYRPDSYEAPAFRIHGTANSSKEEERPSEPAHVSSIR